MLIESFKDKLIRYPQAWPDPQNFIDIGIEQDIAVILTGLRVFQAVSPAFIENT